MRKFLIFLILILLADTALGNELSVSAAEELTPYENFLASINLNYTDTFTGYQYDIVYDPEMLVLNSASPGALIPVDAFDSLVDDTLFCVLLNQNAITDSGQLNEVSFTSTGKTGYTTVTLDNVMLVDQDLNTTQCNVTPAVILVDTAPTVEEIDDQTYIQGSSSYGFVQNINITDEDDADEITVWCDTKPDGAEVDVENATFRWAEPVVGEYTIAFLISDGYLYATESFVLTVVPAYADYDVNMDRSIDILDLMAIANSFGVNTTERVDVNDDGIVNILDMIIVANYFGEIQE
jgi:hypothetical protein